MSLNNNSKKGRDMTNRLLGKLTGVYKGKTFDQMAAKEKVAIGTITRRMRILELGRRIKWDRGSQHKDASVSVISAKMLTEDEYGKLQNPYGRKLKRAVYRRGKKPTTILPEPFVITLQESSGTMRGSFELINELQSALS